MSASVFLPQNLGGGLLCTLLTNRVETNTALLYLSACVKAGMGLPLFFIAYMSASSGAFCHRVRVTELCLDIYSKPAPESPNAGTNWHPSVRCIFAVVSSFERA